MYCVYCVYCALHLHMPNFLVEPSHWSQLSFLCKILCCLINFKQTYQLMIAEIFFYNRISNKYTVLGKSQLTTVNTTEQKMMTKQQTQKNHLKQLQPLTANTITTKQNNNKTTYSTIATRNGLPLSLIDFLCLAFA